MTYFIEQKDGHRYDFHNIKKVRTEYEKGGIEVLVIVGQFKPRQRYKDVRLLPATIKATNIPDIENRMLTWLS